MVYIFILELTGEKYYIGNTYISDFKLSDNFDSSESEWTIKYTPKKITKFIPNCDELDIDKLTIMYMSKYGIDNVRNEMNNKIKLNKEYIIYIENKLKTIENICYICKKNHFIGDCHMYNCEEKSWPCSHCYKKFNSREKKILHELINCDNNDMNYFNNYETDDEDDDNHIIHISSDEDNQQCNSDDDDDDNIQICVSSDDDQQCNSDDDKQICVSSDDEQHCDLTDNDIFNNLHLLNNDHRQEGRIYNINGYKLLWLDNQWNKQLPEDYTGDRMGSFMINKYGLNYDICWKPVNLL